MILHGEKNEINWPITLGCTDISAGCDSCPDLLGAKKAGTDFKFRTNELALSLPGGFPDPCVFHVALGSDLFHDASPAEFIHKVFRVMRKHPRHVFICLTKRAERLDYLPLHWPQNLIMGVVVETRDALCRIKYLKNCGAKKKLVQFAPLLEEMPELDFTGVDFVTAELETWGKKRTGKPEWVESILKNASSQGVDLCQG